MARLRADDPARRLTYRSMFVDGDQGAEHLAEEAEHLRRVEAGAPMEHRLAQADALERQQRFAEPDTSELALPEGPLTVRQAAARENVSERTVHRWITRGEVDAWKSGSQWRIDAAALDAPPRAPPPQASGCEPWRGNARRRDRRYGLAGRLGPGIDRRPSGLYRARVHVSVSVSSAPSVP
jgi:excisionase family DNA binding protein